MREIRRLCHARMNSLTDFQRIQFQSFDEEVGDVFLGLTGQKAGSTTLHKGRYSSKGSLTVKGNGEVTIPLLKINSIS